MKEKIDNLTNRMSSIEATLAPLLARFDNQISVITDLAREIAVSNANYTNQEREVRKVWARQEMTDQRVDQVNVEMAENRPNMKLVSKLPMLMATISIVILGLVGTIFYKIIIAGA